MKKPFFNHWAAINWQLKMYNAIATHQKAKPLTITRLFSNYTLILYRGLSEFGNR